MTWDRPSSLDSCTATEQTAECRRQRVHAHLRTRCISSSPLSMLRARHGMPAHSQVWSAGTLEAAKGDWGAAVASQPPEDAGSQVWGACAGLTLPELPPAPGSSGMQAAPASLVSV